MVAAEPKKKTQWEGRLGIEIVGKMNGCCADSILAWKPQTIGQKTMCRYCNSMMKTVRAGDVLTQEFTGGLNEHKGLLVQPEIVVGSLYFSAKKFADLAAVERWLVERDLLDKTAAELDQHAFVVHLERIIPESVRAIWVASGVVGEIGVAEKQVATGAGQASMSSPGITTTSMASGGTVNPTQGPAAVVAGIPDLPMVLHGMTEVQDGHQHEFHLNPEPSPGGFRVKGLTSFINGHTHMIEAGVNDDGSLDTRTAPDQSPVGGHAHAHRVMFRPESAPMKDMGLVFPQGERAYHVTSLDVVLLRRASGLVQNFLEAVLSDRSGGGSLMASLDSFKEQLGQAIERARGMVASADAMVPVHSDTFKRLESCAKFIDEFGDDLAVRIGMEKSTVGK